MAAFRPGEAWRRFKTRLTTTLVQDCPPGVAACEVCRKLQCSNETWVNCANRQAAERFLRRGEREALDALRRSHAPCTCVSAPAPTRDDQAAC